MHKETRGPRDLINVGHRPWFLVFTLSWTFGPLHQNVVVSRASRKKLAGHGTVCWTCKHCRTACKPKQLKHASSVRRHVCMPKRFCLRGTHAYMHHLCVCPKHMNTCMYVYRYAHMYDYLYVHICTQMYIYISPFETDNPDNYNARKVLSVELQ